MHIKCNTYFSFCYIYYDNAFYPISNAFNNSDNMLQTVLKCIYSLFTNNNNNMFLTCILLISIYSSTFDYLHCILNTTHDNNTKEIAFQTETAPLLVNNKSCKNIVCY